MWSVWISSMWQVSYLWEEIPWLQQCLTSSQTSCSCTLQTRLKMLQAVSQLQVLQCPIIIANSGIYADHLLIAWCYDVKVLNSSVIICWCLSQGLLGTQDLGQVYFEPIKDKHGNALLVLLKDMNTCPNLDGVRWTQLCKLQLQRKSISSPEEPTALDILLIKLHVSPALAQSLSESQRMIFCCPLPVFTAVKNGWRDFVSGTHVFFFIRFILKMFF